MAVEADIVAVAQCITDDGDIPRRHRSRDTATQTCPKLRRKLRKLFEKERRATKAEPLDQTARHPQQLGDAAGLTSEDIQILEALLYYETHPAFASMMDELSEDAVGRFWRHSLSSLPVAIMLGTSANATRRRLAKEAPLVRHGMVSVDDDQQLSLAGRLRRLTLIVGDHRAILRRVTYAVEMRQPPPRIRARIWERQLARHGIEATPADATALAHEFDASPGVAAGATTAADLSAGDIATVRRSVRSLSRVLGRDRPPFKVSAGFNVSLFTSDTDLAALTDRLERRGGRRFSICLDGPPGTGKSAFVRYLADRLGMEVHKRASDLLSMWVGQSEQNIADAFAEARDDEAFLVFDEADSLLADRRGAYRSWEISQVNEMLTWMESHPLPFACTTNYGQKLDSAVLRRFVFKVTLDHLTADRTATAFRSYFNLEPPQELAALRVLTPGDFAVVRREAAVLGQLRDAQALTAMLRVWGSIITVFMLALSAGYLLGGFLSLRRPALHKLGVILLVAGVLICPLVLIAEPAMAWIFERVEDPRYGSLLASLVLFMPPTIILGMISPYAVRLLVKATEESGRVAGTLYFVSTFSSALGTLGTSFYFVLWFELNTIVAMLAGTLALLACLAFAADRMVR